MEDHIPISDYDRDKQIEELEARISKLEENIMAKEESKSPQEDAYAEIKDMSLSPQEIHAQGWITGIRWCEQNRH